MHHYFFFIFGVDMSSGLDFPNLNPHPKSSQSKLNLWQGDENDPNNYTNFNDIFLRLIIDPYQICYHDFNCILYSTRFVS